MADAPRWNANATVRDVQFEWEKIPTPRSVRLAGDVPREGEPVRIGIGGAEVEGMIARFESAVLYVRLAKPAMRKATGRKPARRKTGE